MYCNILLYIQNDWIYSFDSALVALPGLSADGLWQYEVAVTSKSKAIPPAEQMKKLSSRF